MPHLVTHRPRVSNLSNRNADAASHKRWETFSAFSYKLGGLMFVGGSLFFFPGLSDYLVFGDWLYAVGSLLYLMVTGHDLLEVIQYWRDDPDRSFARRIELLAGVTYVTGSLLFVLGSLCFLPAVNAVVPGAWLFIVGSILFVVGGFVNFLQVVEAPSLIYMQLFNLTVGMFVVGSALFVVASVPYLWALTEQAEVKITTFAAAQFLFASVLFFVGGVAIYYRLLVHDKLESFCHASGLGAMFIHELQSEIKERSTLGKVGRRQG